MKKLIMLCLALVLVLSMAGCGQKIEKITDLERFEGMAKDADKIEVSYDNNSGIPYNFVIIDQAKIDEVMEVILSSNLEKIDGSPMPGDNTSLVIYQGDNQYSLGVRANKEGDNYYNFATDDLQNIIKDFYLGIATENLNGENDFDFSFELKEGEISCGERILISVELINKQNTSYKWNGAYSEYRANVKLVCANGNTEYSITPDPIPDTDDVGKYEIAAGESRTVEYYFAIPSDALLGEYDLVCSFNATSKTFENVFTLE